MKSYEKLTEVSVDTKLPYVVRVDGHKFSTFTRGFKKPFDPRLSRAMTQATAAVLHTLQAQTAYTQSDESTFVFVPQMMQFPAPQEDKSTANFSGRVAKLASYAASQMSVKFNYFLMQEEFDSDEAALREKVMRCDAYFDGRVFNVPSVAEALNNILWRSAHDCVRNSRLSWATHIKGHRWVQNKTTDVLVKELAEEGHMWEELPLQQQYGTFLKRENVMKQTVHDGKEIVALRTTTAARAFAPKFSDEFVRLVVSKTWNHVNVAALEPKSLVWSESPVDLLPMAPPSADVLAPAPSPIADETPKAEDES
eukprot:NODE_2508_length_1049_cov_109.477223_g2490_i0.p1 GENE.NODE_2508_length_1049_cov_109.477223_g2490_i0~~NODE_2508_length_1049_cov_109.477223_g2490_i0.p1  ORF type:complete len:339 (+),score=54.95 NODE_2508_length_1049_cov_109.477223_g2490_i0:88-1017(+)